MREGGVRPMANVISKRPDYSKANQIAKQSGWWLLGGCFILAAILIIKQVM